MLELAVEDYRELFKTETVEQLEKLTEIMLDLQEHSDYEEKPIHELFRLAHNIKGASGMMGLESLKNAMHSLESVLGEIRNKKVPLIPDETEMMIQFSRSVAGYIAGDQWDNDQELKIWEPILADLYKANSQSSENLNQPLALSEAENIEITGWQESGKTVYGIEVAYCPDSQMKGASAFVFVKYLEQFGKIYKTVPMVEKLATENFNFFKVILFTECVIDERSITSHSGQDQLSVRIRKWVCRSRPENPLPSKADHPAGNDLIRVDFAKIEKVLRDIETVFNTNVTILNAYNRGNQSFATWSEIGRLIWQQEQLIGTLQADALQLGLVPIKQLFSRFSLITHDIAKKTGKRTEIGFLGETTEIEKRLTEQLLDPLIHLVRNAVDHGLETGETRRATGKPETGKVTLEACQEGEAIVITISDDGRGLDLEKIRAKAVQNNLIHQDDALSDEEIRKLIFMPGFSTADQITDISGRGVGLDVVRNNLAALKGEISVDSKPGRGTSFRLKVPMTQAVVNAFFVRIDNRILGFPLDNVLESRMVENDEILKTAEGNYYYARLDESLPLINLNKIFEMNGDLTLTKIPVLMIRDRQQTAGVMVEEFIGQEKVMLKPLQRIMIHPFITGIATLSNGESALMLDVQKIIRGFDGIDSIKSASTDIQFN